MKPTDTAGSVDGADRGKTLLERLKECRVMRPDARSSTRYEPYVMISEEMRDAICDLLAERSKLVAELGRLRMEMPKDGNKPLANNRSNHGDCATADPKEQSAK